MGFIRRTHTIHRTKPSHQIFHDLLGENSRQLGVSSSSEIMGAGEMEQDIRLR